MSDALEFLILIIIIRRRSKQEDSTEECSRLLWEESGDKGGEEGEGRQEAGLQGVGRGHGPHLPRCRRQRTTGSSAATHTSESGCSVLSASFLPFPLLKKYSPVLPL